MSNEKVRVFKEFLDLVKEVKEVYEMTGHEAHNYLKYALDLNKKEEKNCECNININFYYENIEELGTDEFAKELIKRIKRQQGLK